VQKEVEGLPVVVIGVGIRGLLTHEAGGELSDVGEDAADHGGTRQHQLHDEDEGGAAAPGQGAKV
jgi:hypothetical protein